MGGGVTVSQCHIRGSRGTNKNTTSSWLPAVGTPNNLHSRTLAVSTRRRKLEGGQSSLAELHDPKRLGGNHHQNHLSLCSISTLAIS